MKIYLASGSPRRSKILSELGLKFEVIKTDATEVSYPNDPERTVMENALAKGNAAKVADSSAIVISADTIVWLDGKIYGKPKDLDEARLFLHTLSGRTHYVYTGVACNQNVCVQTSAVTFRKLSDEVIDEYVERMNPLDRAGAYDIDTNGELLIEKFNGSYENIMGLPVEPLAAWGVIRALGDKRPSQAVVRGLTTLPGKRPQSVGFFDSGLGGLCILNAFKKICPNEDTVYIADSANCPYGNKSPEEVLNLCREKVRILRDIFNCKMIVIACNTATAAAIDTLRAEDPSFPYIGIEPAIKPAVTKSHSGRVGVLATAGTFNGRLYRETKEKFAKDVEVIATVADEFVDFVERYAISNPAKLVSKDAEELVKSKIGPLLDAGCDVIVLGCTHFPHLSEAIKNVAGERARVIDPSEAVARHAASRLKDCGIEDPSSKATKVFCYNVHNFEVK